MYHKIGIQKLSHNQILKLLRGERIRVKHGAHHHIHASPEQHKKIMAAHHKGKGVTIQLDPFQQQMAEHHALKGHRVHHGHGEGFLGDMAKKAFKHIAPHAIDWAGNELKHHISGMGEGVKRRGRPRKSVTHMGFGEGEGLHFAHHAHKKFHAGVGHKKRGRPAKVGGAVKAGNQTNPIAATFNMLPSAAKTAIDSDIRNILNIPQPNSLVPNQSGIVGTTLPKSMYATTTPAIEGGLQLIMSNPNFLQSHPNYLANHPKIAQAYKQMGGGVHHKKRGRPRKHSGGALYPAGYYGNGEGEGRHRHHKKGHGEGEGRKRGRPRKGHKKGHGDGVIGSLLGKAIGGIAGRAIGGHKHGHEAGEIGGILGGIAGDFLPF